jgi:hypothetical protein
MSKTKDAPSDNRYSHFRSEEAEVIDVNRKTWTVTVATRHRSKQVEDIQCMVPYTHYQNGEGYHFLPEVGAICMLAWPSDNTPPFIMGFKGAASVRRSEDGAPERSTADPEGSDTDVSFRARRPALNPGDIAMTTRDENFVILRRGGVLQIGATPISQRVYIPILNYIKDYCENYQMNAFGGDITWQVDRVEDDPAGDAPASYTFHMNTYAQDAKATVRVRYMPVKDPGGGDRTAWEVKVAPQGIDRDEGSITGEQYSLIVTTGGDYTEFIAASREVTIQGDDTLTVSGDRTVSVGGTEAKDVDGDMRHLAGGEAVFGGSSVKLASRRAASPGVLGDRLVELLATAQYVVNTSTMTAVMSPASVAQLQRILSRKVFLE